MAHQSEKEFRAWFSKLTRHQKIRILEAIMFQVYKREKAGKRYEPIILSLPPAAHFLLLDQILSEETVELEYIDGRQLIPCSENYELPDWDMPVAVYAVDIDPMAAFRGAIGEANARQN